MLLSKKLMVIKRRNSGTNKAPRKRSGGTREKRKMVGRKRAKMEPQFLTVDKSKRCQT
jgi:hypothetical protein